MTAMQMMAADADGFTLAARSIGALTLGIHDAIARA